MKPLLVAIGLIAAVTIFYVLRTMVKTAAPQRDSRQPSPSAYSTQTKQNDKLVLVKGLSHFNLKRVLTGFCNMYNKERLQVQLRLAKLTEREFAIIFPYDIEFEIFCYFINYMVYPMELNGSPEVTAWMTTGSRDKWIKEMSANKKVMLFIPADDTEHDNVFMTTGDNIGYKLGFSLGDENQRLDTPKKRYVQPDLQIAELTNREFEDFT